MNLLHIKYALTIAETMSINKAAEKLLVGAPALSRAIKELESNLGVNLFERSPKGMFLTPKGEVFIKYAKKILTDVENLEALFENGRNVKEHFSISVPRASYIALAFSEFSRKLQNKSNIEFIYRETNAYRALNNILKKDYNLAILRYNSQYDVYYNTMIKEKGLTSDLICEFDYSIIMNKNCPLAKIKNITSKDLDNYTEIVYADPYVPMLPISEVRKSELPERDGARIFVFERASQFEILEKNNQAYLLASSIPSDLLNKYGLVEMKISNSNKHYKDILVYKDDYRLSKIDKMFIEELLKVKREIFTEN